MLINLSDVFSNQGRTESKEILPEMDSFQFSLGEFKLAKKEPILFQFSNIGEEKALVTAKTSLSFEAGCDRCLSDTIVELELDIEREVASPKMISAEEQEDAPFMKEYQIDIEALLYTEILENWPVKILCKEDCKGVCPVCGQNLNERECGCDTFIPDPRMAAIKDIFMHNKEV